MRTVAGAVSMRTVAGAVELDVAKAEFSEAGMRAVPTSRGSMFAKPQKIAYLGVNGSKCRKCQTSVSICIGLDQLLHLESTHQSVTCAKPLNTVPRLDAGRSAEPPEIKLADLRYRQRMDTHQERIFALVSERCDCTTHRTPPSKYALEQRRGS